MGTLLAGLCGVLIVGGSALVVAGFQRVSPQPDTLSTGLWKKVVDSSTGRAVRRRWWHLALALVAGLMAATLVGWPLLIVLVPVVAYGLPLVLSAPSNRDLAVLEALDRWVRTLGSLLPTGRSISDAIRVSVGQAPALLAPHLRLLTARLDDRWTSGQALLALVLAYLGSLLFLRRLTLPRPRQRILRRVA